MKDKTQWYIFLLFISIAFLFFSRYYTWSDGEPRYQFTRSLVEPNVLAQKITYGPTQSVLAVPFYLIGKYWSGLFGTELDITTRNSVKILVVIAYSAICLYILKSLIFFGTSRLISFISALIFSLTSMALPYASSFFSELLSGALLLITIYYSITYADSSKISRLIIAQFALLLLALNNFLFILCIPILYLYLLSKSRNRHKIAASAFFLTAVISSLLIFLYNYWRYHDIFNFGYAGNSGYPTIIYNGKPGFSGNILVGLYGFLFSSGKSIFIYNPSLLLFFACYSRFLKERRKEFILFIAIFTIFTIIYAKWWAWYGGICWGPRFLLPLLSPLYVIIGYGLKELLIRKKWFVITILFLGFLAQFIAVSIHPTRDLSTWAEPEFQNEYLLWFVPHFSPVFTHWKYLKSDGVDLLHTVNDDPAGRLLFFVNIIVVVGLLYLILRRINTRHVSLKDNLRG